MLGPFREPGEPPAGGASWPSPGEPASGVGEETLDRPPTWPGTPPDSPESSEDILTGSPGGAPHTGQPAQYPTQAYENGARPTEEAPLGSGETLIRPSAQGTTSAPAAGPQVVHGYEILGVLGRGGMGVVYKAKQIGLNRLVALKMVLAGSHASEQELARFKTEAEAVARLQHPNIVQIYDIDEKDGRPFIALEYIEGGSLQQRLDGTPLPPRQAAQLVETLARAIDFAHRRGIVHRDLKPANILLTGDATPKITDFGLAKRLDEQGVTGTEAILGTPSYMAPEQAAGKTRTVGPGADIYALGAILYDLLTGGPPFRGTTVLDTLQMVQNSEPVPPARLQPALPVDLQTICLKCLEKDAARRYPSAAQLADDLARFLEGRPIEARPTSIGERMAKWARRHPAAAALVALSAVAPLVITGLILLYIVTLHNANIQLASTVEERDHAIHELDQKNVELRASESALRQALGERDTQARVATLARDRAEKQEADAQDSFLRAQRAAERLLRLAQKELRNKPGTEALRRSILEEALAMCLHFTDRPGNNPSARLRAARALRMVGDLEVDLGQARAAVNHYQASLRLYEGLLAGNPVPRLRSLYEGERTEVTINLWGALSGLNSPAASGELDRGIAHLEALPAEVAGEPVHRRNLAALLVNRAVHYQNLGQDGRADADYQEALKILAELSGRPDARLEQARIETNRATLRVTAASRTTGRARLQELEQARQGCERAIAIVEQLLAASPDEAAYANELGRAYTNLGLVQVARNEWTEASRIYEKAVGVFADLHQRHEQTVDYKHLLAVARGNLGLHLLRLGFSERAVEPIKQGRLALQELVAGFRDVPVYRHDLARLCTSQGLALNALHRIDEAVEPFRAALTHLEELDRVHPGPGAIRSGEVAKERLGAINNLLVCHDQLARRADRRRDAGAALRHVSALTGLRREQVELLRKRVQSAECSVQNAEAKKALHSTLCILHFFLARTELANTLVSLVGLQERTGDYRGAARTVAELTPLVSLDWPGHLDSATVLARCARSAWQDKRLTTDERSRLAEQHARAAVTLLEQLAEDQPAGVAQRLRGPDFDWLRRTLPATQSALTDLERRLPAGHKSPP